MLAVLLITALLASGFSSHPVAAADLASSGSTPEVTLLAADSRSMTVVFSFDESHLRLEAAKEIDAAGQSCQRIELVGGAMLDQAGLPDLPLFSKLVGLPPQGQFSLSVETMDSITLPETVRICPALSRRTEVSEDGSAQYVETKATPDLSVYGQNQAFPAEIAQFSDLGFMRSQRLGRIQISPVQFNPVSGQVTLHRRVVVTLNFDNFHGDLRTQSVLSGQAVAEPQVFETTFANTLLNYDQAQAWRVAPDQSAGLAAASTQGAEAANVIWTPPSPAYRVTLNQTGMYKLTQADLAGAGLPVDTLDPRTLRLFNRGSQVAINVTGQDDGKFDAADLVIFYGQGVDTLYTDANVYWLTYGGANGLRMQTATTSGNGTAVNSYTETVAFERNLNYVSTLPKLQGYDHWYDISITALTNSAGQIIPGSTLYGLRVSNPAQGTMTATLTATVAGNNLGTHHLFLLVNDQEVGDFTWDNRNYYEAVAEVPQSLLIAGNNKITVRNSTDLSVMSVDTVYIDGISLAYQRQLQAISNRLDFADSQAGSWSYTLGGFTAGDVTVYDVTAPGQVAEVPATVAGGNVSFSRSSASARSYVAVDAGHLLSPQAIASVDSTPLKGSGVGVDTGADYIIIAHPDFLTDIKPLATYRASQNMRVRTVNVQDIYDQFGYGLPSAEAIRDFLAYAYSNWPGSAPSYVLLVGDATYDVRQYVPTSAATYIPAFLALVDPDLGETAAENRYVMLTGDDLLADMYIGRFPANSPEEVQVMVEKTINYETAPPSGDWQNRALFVTDDLSNGGGAFYAFSNEVADGTLDETEGSPLLLPESYERIKVYMGPTCDTENPSVECRNQIIQAINQGVSIVSYVGHGTKQAWAAEELYDESLVNGLNNGDKLPVILAMTCQEGYFQLTTLSALAETSVRIAGKGSVASWSPTGFGLATGHDLLEKGFMMAVFHEETPQLGPATQRGKLNLAENAPANRYDDLMDTFMLFGDPALRLVGTQQGSDIFLPLVVR